MRKLLVSSAVLLALGAATFAGDLTWLTKLDEATKEAKAKDRLILVAFSKDDSSLSKKLKDEVFATKEFAEWSKNFVLLSAGTDADLEKKYDVHSVPTVLFIDADGRDKGRTAYVKGGPAAWTKKADEALAEGAKPKNAKPEKPSPSEAKDEGWGESWDKASARARKDKKVVLADFTGSDWCPWCVKLHDEVFSKDEFKKWASEKVVLLEVDFPEEKAQSDELKEQNQKLQKKYGIQGYPTVLLLDGDGKKLGQLGYMEGGPKAWIKKAQDILDGKDDKDE